MSSAGRDGRSEQVEVPALGLGTWQNSGHDQCVESVRTALEVGYRHVDTAQAYGNEAAVGEGIEAAAVDREEVFLATKVWKSDLDAEGVRRAAETSLERLRTDHLDLLYVHWPAGEYDPEGTLDAFASLREEGLIDHVGVSNFEPEHLERAREAVDVPIAVTQVEMHPLCRQQELREYCDREGIELVAYSPIARGAVFDVDVLSDIADRHDATEAQVSLAWIRQRGAAAIPKATGEDHIRENWASRELTLSDDELARIDDLDREERQVDPEFAPDAW